MAVNPLSTPIKTEYKPLGLEAFAQPLSDMQAKFDTTKAEIEAADFALSRLSKDDPRAKDLIKEIEGKRDELAANLMNTGNYRQASSKLAELNRVYNKDEETNAIKTNYENYQKAVKEQKERVDKGDITQEDYDLWNFRVNNSFEGTNYDRKTDTYSSINVHPRMKNMEKELREESLKIAGMLPEQIEEFLQRNKVDAFTTERIQTLIKKRGLEQGAREIEQFLRTSDQYKNWVKEDADYKWYYNTNNDPEYKEKYVNSVVDDYDRRIAYYAELAKDPEATALATKEIARLEKDKNDLIAYGTQALNEGTFDNFAKTVFFNQAEGRFRATAYGASDIVDMTSLTLEAADQTDAAKKGRADASVKKLEEIGTIGTNIAATTGDPSTAIISGTATNTADENVIVNYRKDAFTMMKNITPDEVPDIPRKGQEALSAAQKPIVENAQNTSKDLYVTVARMGNFQKREESLTAEIDLKKEALSKATSTEEKKQLTDELNTMYQDKEELRLALTDDTRTFDNIIGAEINADYVPAELKKKYEQEYQNNPVKFLQELRATCNNYIEGIMQPSAAYEQQRQESIAKWYRDNPDRSLTPEQEEALFPKQNLLTPSLEIKNAPPEVKFAEAVTKAYKWNLSSKFDAIGSEVIMNKNFDAMTNGDAKEIVTYVSQNTRGKSDVKKVDYNILTGETKKDSKGNRFDLAVYNADPHFSGVDKNGDIILRYVLKSDYDPQTATAKTAIANYIKTEKGAADSETVIPTAAEIAAWREANPTDLYIAVEGRSKNLTETAAKNYVDIAEAGIAYNDGEIITQNLNNFAPVHLNSNASRKEAYYKMAARLADAVKNDHKYTELIQGPAAWNDNGNGTFTAYQITYKVMNGDIIAQINQGTMGADKKVNWKALTSKTISETSNNLPTALAALDLTYGTGREEDLIHAQRGFNEIIFVPAFENPGIALQGR